MKKIAISLGVIGVVAAIVIGATTAYFSDTETSTGNTFTAGTLNLELSRGEGWENGADGAVTIGNMAPGVPSDEFDFYMGNFGSMAGKASWKITNIAENDIYPESSDKYKALNEDLGRTADCSQAAGDGCVPAEEFAKNVYVYSASFDRDGSGAIEPCGTDNNLVYDDTTACNNIDFDESKCSDLSAVEAWWWELEDMDRECIIREHGWQGAPQGIDDEWVLPDWIAWGDWVHGNQNAKLGLNEVQAANWTIDDKGIGTTQWMDPGDQYSHYLKFMLNPDAGNEFQAEGIDVTVTARLDQVE